MFEESVQVIPLTFDVCLISVHFLLFISFLTFYQSIWIAFIIVFFHHLFPFLELYLFFPFRKSLNLQ